MDQRHRLPSLRTLAVIAVIVAPIAGLWLRDRSRRLEVERRAGLTASAIAGRPVTVHCPGPIRRVVLYETTEGSVRFVADGRPFAETNLSKRPCGGLRRALDHGSALNLDCLAYRCPDEDERIAMSLAVLAHESVHLKGVVDESATECEARTHVAAVAVSFGLTTQAAQSVARWQATDYAELLPERYRAGC
jgi:hypothetical protein